MFRIFGSHPSHPDSSPGGGFVFTYPYKVEMWKIDHRAHGLQIFLHEWSNGVGSRSTSASCVASNPTGVMYANIAYVLAERQSLHTAMRSKLEGYMKIPWAISISLYLCLSPSTLCFPVWHQMGMFGAEMEIRRSHVPFGLYGIEPTRIAAGRLCSTFLAAIGILATSNNACLFGLLQNNTLMD